MLKNENERKDQTKKFSQSIKPAVRVMRLELPYKKNIKKIIKFDP